jgi:hypothetical protein
LTVSVTASLFVDPGSATVSAEAGREASTNAALAVPRRRRRDNKERNGSNLSTAVPATEF